jgi:UDP-4-amino-4,6-dideoxy-N-acetyl-beta-L-altrosamine transaminase
MNDIPYGRQWITEQDIEAVAQVLRSNWLTCGPAVRQFEEAIAKSCGARHAVAVSNGTAALHLACLALGLGPKHKGVTSPLTFLASANCLAYCQARPDFVDIDPDRLCLSPSGLEAYIDRNGTPDVVIPVDFSGIPADLPRIQKLAERYGFAVIEDAAHSLGSRYYHDGQWFRCGSCAHTELAILSFHPVKTLTTGEGGMVLTNNDKLARRLRMLANHGIERDPSQFEPWPICNATGDTRPGSTAGSAPWLHQQQMLGYNYRITDMQSALGLSQLGRLDQFIARRRAIVARYNDAFRGMTRLLIPPQPENVETAYHLYPLRFRDLAAGQRRQIDIRLRQAGIFAQVHYIPVYWQPWYREQYGYQPGLCPSAEAFYAQSISLPLFPAMTDEDVGRVISEILLLAAELK